ncbi:hypothetical protein HDU84_000581, partial [Entophlyctis sp. JEL0112]
MFGLSSASQPVEPKHQELLSHRIATSTGEQRKVLEPNINNWRKPETLTLGLAGEVSARFHPALDFNPLRVYQSALTFTPHDTTLYRLYHSFAGGKVTASPKLGWGPLRYTANYLILPSALLLLAVSFGYFSNSILKQPDSLTTTMVPRNVACDLLGSINYVYSYCNHVPANTACPIMEALTISQVFDQFIELKKDDMTDACPYVSTWLKQDDAKGWHFKDNLIAYASENGHVDVLEWCKNSGLKMNWINMAGSVEVLEWWKNSGLELKWSSHAIGNAMRNKRIDILNWWKESGLEMKGQESQDGIYYAVYYASRNGDIEVLDWWFSSGMELKYLDYTLDNVKDVKVLEWWAASGLEMKYDHTAMDTATDIAILDWWKSSGLELKYTSLALCYAKTVEVLNWWKSSGLELKLSNDCYMDGPVKLLDWWIYSGLEVNNSKWAMDMATTVEVLDWWLASGLELKYNEWAMDMATTVEVLDWWLASGLEL